METGATGYAHFDTKLKGNDMLKSKFMTETVNKSLRKDGKEMTQTMGKDEFLKLLVTELQNQDPTNPMQDREFIAQMAQFTSMEQMMNMNKGMEKLAGTMNFQSSFELLGRTVSVNNESAVDTNNAVIHGMVESVSKSGNEVMVKVNGRQYPLSSVMNVE